MVASVIGFRVRAATASFAAGLAFISTPAFANASDADIAAPLRKAEAARSVQPGSIAAGNQEFRALFASWRALDKTMGEKASGLAAAISGAAIASPASVSIPSRSPVDSYHMTSEFGMRWHPVLGGHRPHKGIDLADPVGTPVHATADGVIGRADWFSGYGLYVQIEHGGNIETRYGHMSRLNVAAGQLVHKGDIVGYVGRTGRATGPHLHYEVRVAGEAVNPMPYMQGKTTTLLALSTTGAPGAKAPPARPDADSDDD